jgi:hypothetical protein
MAKTVKMPKRNRKGFLGLPPEKHLSYLLSLVMMGFLAIFLVAEARLVLPNLWPYVLAFFGQLIIWGAYLKTIETWFDKQTSVSA